MRHALATATVFVDDAVTGRLPPVCVVDGVPATDQISVNHVVGGGGLGIAWLLVLAGPLGWLGLLVIAAFRADGELLTIQLPVSDAARSRIRHGRRARRRVAAVLMSAVVLAFGLAYAGGRLADRQDLPGAATDLRILALALGAVAVAAAVRLTALALTARRRTIAVSLDASRRWVVLRGVHPAFAAAVRDRDLLTQR